MNWVQRVLSKMVWPKIKQEILKYIKSEETQKKYVDLINKKLDIPNLSEEAETKLLNQVYDAGQEALVEVVEGINLDKIRN
jgi:hypothetical protein